MTRQLPVSVVIPAYNRADTIARAVRSALQQAPAVPAEVLVVDDCSADETAAVAEAAGARVLRLAENQGEGGARNAGVAAAAHDWLAFLDSDDEWYPWHLDAVWAHRDGNVLVAGSVITTRARRVEGNAGRRTLRLRTPLDVVWPSNPVFPSAVLVHRPALVRAGGFAKLPYCADLDTWFRVLEQGPGVVLETVTGSYHEHAGQVSGDRAAMRRAELSVYDTYRDRAWWHAGVRERLVLKDRWDTARSAQSAGRRTEWARSLIWFATPGRALVLARLLRSRWQMRRRGRQFDLDAATSGSAD